MKEQLNNFYEIFEKVYSDLKDQLKYAENKNSILITIVGILFVPIFTIFSIDELRSKILNNNWIISSWIITIIIGFLIFITFSISCMPISKIKFWKKLTIWLNKKQNNSINIFFYKWWIKSYKDCKQQIIELYDIENSAFINQLLEQIYDYSFIINRKYFYSKIIICSFSFFSLLLCVSFFLLMFL